MGFYSANPFHYITLEAATDGWRFVCDNCGRQDDNYFKGSATLSAAIARWHSHLFFSHNLDPDNMSCEKCNDSGFVVVGLNMDDGEIHYKRCGCATK